MAPARKAQQTVVLSGPPRRLRLQTELPEIAEARFEPDDALQRLAPPGRPFRTRTDQRGRLRKIVARLDRSTPPGNYHARLESADGGLPVLVHVEPYLRLGIKPANLVFHGKAGSKPEARAVLINKGNVPLEIPEAVTVSMCSDDGLEKALTSALLLDSNELGAVFSHFIDRLRATHGGLLPLVFTEGSGSLAPGGQVPAVIRAEFSSRMAAGQSYHGLLTMHAASQIVSATVTG